VADRKLAGVILATYTVNSIRELIGTLDIGQNGYGFIMSKQGVLISHPQKELATGRTSLMAVAKKNKDDNLLAMANRAVAGESGFFFMGCVRSCLSRRVFGAKRCLGALVPLRLINM